MRALASGSVLQIAAVAMVLIGVLIAGYGVISSVQSTPYMVQSEAVSAPGNERVVGYEQLTANQQRIFERTLVGAAPVEKTDLTVFANSVVEYRGDYYAFELFVDEAGLDRLVIAAGVTAFVAGGGLFFVGRFVRRRSSGVPA